VKSISKISTDIARISISLSIKRESRIRVCGFFIIQGKFYICSKTLVYESDNKNVPLVKFKLENLKALPTFSTFLLIF